MFLLQNIFFSLHGPGSGQVWPTDPCHISLERADLSYPMRCGPDLWAKRWPELRAIKVAVRVRDLRHLALVLVARTLFKWCILYIITYLILVDNIPNKLLFLDNLSLYSILAEKIALISSWTSFPDPAVHMGTNIFFVTSILLINVTLVFITHT